jgi:mono/diheme cytochrome c family protein
LVTPLGLVYSSNITPDRAQGIGGYSLVDFVRLMRLGVRPDGARLYPAMPYTAYAKVSDADLQDLYAYLMGAVPAVPQANHPAAIPWPLSIRWPLALWNRAFHDDHRFAPDPGRGAPWNRGAYLVQGLAHCGTCHTPRGLAFQEKDVDGRSSLFLSGARLDGESPVNLRGNPGDGLGRWSADEIAELLAAGRSPHSAAVGQMGEVVAHSTQFMTPSDRAAIAVYLKSLSPVIDAGRATFAASDATLDEIMAGKQTSPGGRVFMDSCAACHRLSGAGAGRTLPQLAGNAAVLAQYPDSLIRVILNGARLPATGDAPSRTAMPPFGWRYDDQQVAALATYVRRAWGNSASPVTAAQVKAVRRRLAAEESRR